MMDLSDQSDFHMSDDDEEYEPSDSASDESYENVPTQRSPRQKVIHGSMADEVISAFGDIIEYHKPDELTIDTKMINVQVHSNDSKRIYDKVSSCFYCGKDVIKLSSHLLNVHSDENLIKEINAMPKRSNKRKLALEKLRLKGNFVHNMKVLQQKTGTLYLLRRPSRNILRKHSHYIPCIYCLGFVHKLQACKHMNKCPHRGPAISKKKNQTYHSKLILSAMSIREGAKKDYIQLISNLRDGPVKEFLKVDETLILLGSSLLMRKGNSQKKNISMKLRHLAKFVQDYMVKYEKTLTLKEVLQPCNFNNCLELAKEMCRQEDSYDTDKPITTSIKLGIFIKDALEIIKIEAIKSNDDVCEKNCIKFGFLLQTQWSHEINSPSLRTLQENKAKVNAMPITEDLVKLAQYIESEVRNGTDALNANQSLNVWSSLATVVLANLIMFNRRREGEVSKIKLTTYTERPDYSEAETDLLKQSLAPSEMLLYDKYHYMNTTGKRGRMVPLIFSNNTKLALDALVQHRETCGISSKNKYLFANSKQLYIRGNDALHKCISRCNIKRPHLIKSTNMRKHVATVAQVLSLSSGDIEHLSNHLGHDLNVHHQFYRLHESTIETTKIVKLLSLVNSGNIPKYKNKNLDEIDLDDVVADATVEEPIPDDNENVDNPRPINLSSGSDNIKTPIVGRKRWDSQVKSLARKAFRDCIDHKRPPKKEQCMEFIDKYGVKDRTWREVKTLVYNEYRCTK